MQYWGGGILLGKLCSFLALCVFSFVLSCKHNAKDSGGNDSPTLEEVSITVRCDEHVKLKKDASFNVKKGSAWKAVKEKAKDIIASVDEGFELSVWKLENKDGIYLSDSYVFKTNTTVFIGTKIKGSADPEMIFITITVDKGAMLIDAQAVNVDKGTKWQSIKNTCNQQIKIKEGFSFVCWKLSDQDGIEIKDDYSFEENKTVFAQTKENQNTPDPNPSGKIIITVEADEGYTLDGQPTFALEKEEDWKFIKEKAEEKVSLKAGYKKTGVTIFGVYIKDDVSYSVKVSATVRAVSVKEGEDEEKDKSYFNLCGDEGIDIKISNFASLRFHNGTLWKDFKIFADDNKTVKEGYEFLEWVHASGEKMTDESVITRAGWFCAASKRKDFDPNAEFPITDAKFFKTDGHGTITGYTCEKEELPKNLVFPSTIDGVPITKIGPNAFDLVWTYEILDLSKMESLKTIAKAAFCTSKARVIRFPASLEEIEDADLKYERPTRGAFAGLRELDVLEFPQNSKLKRIGIGAFEDLCYPVNAYFDPQIPKHMRPVKIDLSNCTELEEIGDFAFFQSPRIVDAPILPDSVKVIGKYAFASSAFIKGVLHLPKNLEIVKFNAFGVAGSGGGFPNIHGYLSLTGLDFSKCSNLTTIEEDAFEALRDCTSVDFSGLESLKEIGKSSFSGIGAENIVLPPKLEIVGDFAFSGAKTKTFTLPKTLKKIGEHAFWDSAVESVNFSSPNSLEHIREYAFYKTKLKSLDLSSLNSLEIIEDSAFRDCEELGGGIKFPPNLKTIGEYAFSGFDTMSSEHITVKITKLDFSQCKKIENIGGGAFRKLDFLKEVDFSNANIKKIDKNAFCECKKLETLNMDKQGSIEVIEAEAFAECPSIKGILNFSKDLKKIGWNVFGFANSSEKLVNKGLEELDFSNCTKLEKIGEYSFSGCIGVKKIDFSNCGVKEIEDDAFNLSYSYYDNGNYKTDCNESLEELDFSPCENLKELGRYNFNNLSALKNITLPRNLKKLENNFNNCDSFVGEIVLPKAIEEYKKSFCNCDGIETLHLENANTEIRSSFNDCKKLKTMIIDEGEVNDCRIPNCIESLILKEGIFTGEEGFRCYGESLKTLDLRACSKIKTLKSVGSRETIEKVLFPTSLEKIGSRAFSETKKIEDLDLSSLSKLKTIDSSAFYRSNLKKIKLPSAITYLGERSFSETPIKSIDMSNCILLEEIDSNLFDECKELQSIKLPPSIKNIGDSAFNNCTSLTSIDLFSCTELLSIKEEAFKGCVELSGTIKFPKKLKTIERWAFIRYDESSPSLKKIEELDFSECEELETIGQEAFQGLEGVTHPIILGKNIKTIDLRAFKNCSAVPEIDLSKCTQLKRLNYEIFYGCKNANVILPSSIEESAYSTRPFGNKGDENSLCKNVTVPNEAIKELVAKTGYPKDRIIVK